MAKPAASAADGAWILTPPGADRRLDHALTGDGGGQRHGPCAQVDAGVGVGLKEFGDEEHDDVVGIGAEPGLLEHPGQRRRLSQDLLLLGCGDGVRAHGVLLDGPRWPDELGSREV